MRSFFMVACALMFGVSGGALAQTSPVTAPADWDNKTPAEQTANWRLYRVWPDDWRLAENYKPLVWGTAKNRQQKWLANETEAPAEGSHGGQPAVTVENGVVRLSARSSWDKKPGEDKPQVVGHKIPAIAFVAPEDGVWSVSFVAVAKFFPGSKPPMQILVVKRPTDGSDVKMLLQELIEDADPVELPALPAQLKKGDELIVMPWFNGRNKAGVLAVSKLQVTYQGAAPAPALATQPSATQPAGE